MITDTDIANSADRFVDAKYALGDISRGWDCLNSLRAFYDGIGVTFPTEFEGINETNYPEVWAKDEGEARQILRRFLTGLGRSVGLHSFRRGDLVLFQVGEAGESLFPGIYLGNGNIIVNWGRKHGMRVVPLRAIHRYLLDVRRLM